MQKKINIDQIPGVFKASVLLNVKEVEKRKVNNEKLKDQLLGNLDRVIGFYKEMENVDSDISIKEACAAIIKLSEATWRAIDDIDDSHMYFKKELKRSMDKLIGYLGFWGTITSSEEAQTLLKDVIDTMEILLEDVYYR